MQYPVLPGIWQLSIHPTSYASPCMKAVLGIPPAHAFRPSSDPDDAMIYRYDRIGNRMMPVYMIIAV